MTRHLMALLAILNLSFLPSPASARWNEGPPTQDDIEDIFGLFPAGPQGKDEIMGVLMNRVFPRLSMADRMDVDRILAKNKDMLNKVPEIKLAGNVLTVSQKDRELVFEAKIVKKSIQLRVNGHLMTDKELATVESRIRVFEKLIDKQAKSADLRGWSPLWALMVTPSRADWTSWLPLVGVAVTIGGAIWLKNKMEKDAAEAAENPKCSMAGPTCCALNGTLGTTSATYVTYSDGCCQLYKGANGGELGMWVGVTSPGVACASAGVTNANGSVSPITGATSGSGSGTGTQSNR